MPIIARAAKKLRHDARRSVQNEQVRRTLKIIVKSARKNPNKKSVSSAFAALDKAAKHNVIHKNTAARLKSRLGKLIKK